MENDYKGGGVVVSVRTDVLFSPYSESPISIATVLHYVYFGRSPMYTGCVWAGGTGNNSTVGFRQNRDSVAKVQQKPYVSPRASKWSRVLFFKKIPPQKTLRINPRIATEHHLPASILGFSGGNKNNFPSGQNPTGST